MTVSFIPMRMINKPAVKIVDIAGKEHDVIVIRRETGFVARSPFADEPGRSTISAEEAVQQLLLTINHNHPKQFECMEPEKQRQLLTWIRLHLRKGSKGNTKRWGSYRLKDVVGRAVGFYVGHGELKGAMQAAGLASPEDCAEYDTHWIFVLERSPRLWPFAWRLVSHKIGHTNIDHYFALLNPSRS